MPSYHVKAIDDALRVLDFLAQVGRLAGHQEIAEATRVQGANLTRTLATLKTDGWAEEPADGRWVAGPRLAAAAAHALAGRLGRAAMELESVVQAIDQLKEKKDGR